MEYKKKLVDASRLKMVFRSMLGNEWTYREIARFFGIYEHIVRAVASGKTKRVHKDVIEKVFSILVKEAEDG